MPKRPYTEAQRKAALKWEEHNYDRMSIGMLRGSDVDKATIQAAAKAAGMSANAYILEAVREKMSRDAPQSVANALVSPSESVFGGGGIRLPSDAETPSEGE